MQRAVSIAKNERIGVVLVHGMGEQRRFQHLSSTVFDLLDALNANNNISASVETRTTSDSSYLAEHETWLADTEAPVRIDVNFNSGKSKQKKSIHIHEVWWG